MALSNDQNQNFSRASRIANANVTPLSFLSFLNDNIFHVMPVMRARVTVKLRESLNLPGSTLLFQHLLRLYCL
jgi:hypothetical protein